MNNEQIWLAQTRSLLHHNVPRFIAHIKARGGVKQEEWEWLQAEFKPIDYSLPKNQRGNHPSEKPIYIQDVFSYADDCLLFPSSVEQFEASLFCLVKAIAIMSFVPGGIRLFGLRFCSEIDNFVDAEDGCGET